MDIKCDQCDAIATVHFTQILNGKKCATHLCDWCMANRPPEAKPQAKSQTKSQINLPALLQAILGQNELAQAICPCCGIGFMEFRGQGQLGCPHDYQVFRLGLMPLLKRIHSRVRHLGKKPSRGTFPEEIGQKLLLLRSQLNQAVAAENFEQAAVLKRQILTIQEKRALQESPSNES